MAAPIGTSPLIVTHAFNINNAAMKVTVQGTDVMGACVDPTLPTSVESCTAETMMTVSASDCSYPVVVIVDQASVFTSPRTSHRSTRLDLRAIIDINCATTLLNTKVGKVMPAVLLFTCTRDLETWAWISKLNVKVSMLC